MEGEAYTEANGRFDQDNNRGVILQVYAQLRKMILEGLLPPGASFKQNELAKELGVSRTPMREAVRMLQNEGLVVAELNQRAKVATINAPDLDAFYAKRILLEVLGIRLTVPGLSQAELEGLDRALAEMDLAAKKGDFGDWDKMHRHFHGILVSGSGEELRSTLAGFTEKSEFYRRIYTEKTGPVRAGTMAFMEHSAIVEAAKLKQVELAGQRLARHLARTALTLIARAAPEFEPVATRTALQVVGATSEVVDGVLPKPGRLNKAEKPERNRLTGS